MVGFCHGGNMPASQYGDGDGDDGGNPPGGTTGDDDGDIPTMTKSHHGGKMSVMMKVGMCQCQKPTIHHD